MVNPIRVPAACFTKHDRLLTAAQYSAVFNVGSSVKNKHLVFVFSNTEQPQARLGLAISKKCASRAVDRNRIKRIAREWFRLSNNKLPAVDIVVLGRHSASNLSTQELHKSFSHLGALLAKRNASARNET